MGDTDRLRNLAHPTGRKWGEHLKNFLQAPNLNLRGTFNRGTFNFRDFRSSLRGQQRQPVKKRTLWTEDRKKKILRAARLIALFRASVERRYAFYGAPKQKKLWKDGKEPELHTDWADLFFDLFYVGAAYNVGKMIKHGISNNDVFVSTFLSLTIFLCLMQAWCNKTEYTARMTNKDVVHKLVDYAEACTVAISTVFIPNAPDFCDRARDFCGAASNATRALNGPFDGTRGRLLVFTLSTLFLRGYRRLHCSAR